MNRLFIIGNGFDISHGLKTSYRYFKEYLRREYPDQGYGGLPEGTQMPDGSIEYDDDEVVGFLLYVISNVSGVDWCDLEDSLGYLDFDEYFDYLPEIVDSDGDIDLLKTAYNNEDLANELIIPATSITSLFEDWINTIEIPVSNCRKASFSMLSNFESDYFLNFNYTRTLQEVYNAKKVCHIHGNLHSEIYFGHGNNSNYYEQNMSRNIGSQDGLEEIHHSLKKNTKKALDVNEEFFNIIADTKQIYSYGFSFSSVDLVYIRKICESLSTESLTWYLNDYDSEEKRNHYKNIIRQCGFLGNFDTFTIND